MSKIKKEKIERTKKIAFWFFANLMLLFPMVYFWIFVYARLLSDNFPRNYLVWGITFFVIFCLTQVVIFLVEHNFKDSHRKVAETSLISLFVTLFWMLLFYKEAYYEFGYMVFVEIGSVWVSFSFAVYVLTRMFASDRMSKVSIFWKGFMALLLVLVFVVFNLLPLRYGHSEPRLDRAELFVCTDKFGEFEQFGPWFKKSKRGICVKHSLCDSVLAENLGCDYNLGHLHGKNSNSWQRTNVAFLEIKPYSYKEGDFVENPEALEDKHVVSDAYLFKTNKGAGFYCKIKSKEWLIDDLDFESFEAIGGFYFKDKQRVYYKDRRLKRAYNIHHTNDVEYMGDNCLRYGEFFYKKGKKVQVCKSSSLKTDQNKDE